jgi:hypothetical protein
MISAKRKELSAKHQAPKVMFRNAKLRGPVGRIYPITIISFYVLGIIEFLIRKHYSNEGYDNTVGPLISIYGAALFFFVMGIYHWFRYRLWVYPVLGLLLMISTAHSAFHYSSRIFTLEGYLISLFLVTLFIVFAWSALYSHEKYEAKTRRLFKLAVDQIGETSAGYTERPYSAGEANYTMEEVQGMARYLKSKHIAMPQYSSRGVFLLFSLGKSVVREPDPAEVSYVHFNEEGKINVQISPFDYKQYTKRYTFDQLCSSFGDMFRRFLEYYKEGHEERILAELRSV